jgi:sugar lactone lactonase YvrE
MARQYKPRAQVGFDVRTGLGEGALWDWRGGALISVDILAGRVLVSDPSDGSTRSIEVGQPVSAAMLRGDRELLLAVRDGFKSLDLATDAVTELVEVEADRAGNRMNDGACDARGRCLAGTMAFDTSPGAGTLYRLDPDLSVHALVGGLSISNGIGWSPSGELMYHVDTPTLGVDAYDYDEATGLPSARRRLVDADPAWGSPDGLAVDAEGGIWVAFWDGAAVRRFDPAGAVTATIELSVARPTKPAFGGADLDRLYVTTAAGPILVAEPGVRGLRANVFAG